jgi:hypothetical protein
VRTRRIIYISSGGGLPFASTITGRTPARKAGRLFPRKELKDVAAIPARQ